MSSQKQKLELLDILYYDKPLIVSKISKENDKITIQNENNKILNLKKVKKLKL